MYAIIGGSGLAHLGLLNNVRREVMRTPYGEPSGALTFGEINGHEVVFLARHGYGHTIPPHAINYRANLWALERAGVDAIVAVASVGGINPAYQAGTLVVPDQIIDYTWGRQHTFFEGAGQPVIHIDFTQPYSESVRQQVLAAADGAGEPVIMNGVYACMQGPRLETAAEINRLERDGADMVGMTGMPEAALARELEIPYAALAVVANPAAGRDQQHSFISGEQIAQQLSISMERVRNILVALLTQNDQDT